MRSNCNFHQNPAFVLGVILLWAGVFSGNVLELQGVAHRLAHFACGLGVGLSFVGLLYGSSKTRPLFDRIRAVKVRLLGR